MRQKLITILALLLWSGFCGSAWGDVWHVKATGSKVAGSSTPGDWSDANCYSDIQVAVNKMTTDGDQTIVDDGVWEVATYINNAAMNAAGNGTFTIVSRSNDPSGCTIQSTSAVDPIFSFRENILDYDMVVKGFWLTHTVTYTDNTEGSVCRLMNGASDATFENCWIRDITIDHGGHASISMLFSSNDATRTWYFTDSIFKNITATTDISAAPIVVLYSQVTEDVVVSGCTFQDCSHTNANAGGGSRWFLAQNDLNISNVWVDNCDATCPASGSGVNTAFFTADDTEATLTVSNLNGYNMDWAGGEIHGVLLRAYQPYTITNLTFYDSTAIEDASNGLGGAFLSYGSGATGTVTGLYVNDVTCQHGCATYASQGGGVTIYNADIYNCTATGREGVEPGGGGAFYFGGWGNAWVRNSLIRDCTADEGGAIHVSIHLSATQNKHTELQNITVVDCTATGGDGGYLAYGLRTSSADETYFSAVTVQNCIFRNGGDGSSSYELYFLNPTPGEYHVYNSNINGGASNVFGEDVYIDNIDVDPLLTAEYHLNEGSPCINAGKAIPGFHTASWTDGDGNATCYGCCPDMGAYEYQDGFIHWPNGAWGTSILYVSVAGGTYGAGSGGDGLSWETAKTTIESAIDNCAGTDYDLIVLDPTDTFTHADVFNTSGSGKGSQGGFGFTSLWENPDTCRITGYEGTNVLFNHNKSGVSATYVGITFADHTRTDTTNCWTHTQSGATLYRVNFDNLNGLTTGGGTGPLVYFNVSDQVARMEDCEVTNCSFAAASALCGQFLGVKNDNTTSLLVDGLVVSGNSTSVAGGLCYGGIYAPGGVTFYGTNSINNNYTENTSGDIHGFIEAELFAYFNGNTSIHDNAFKTTSGDCQGGIAYFYGPNVYVEANGILEVYRNTLDCGGNPIGMWVCYQTGSTMYMTGPGIDFWGNRSEQADGTISVSQGASLKAYGIGVHDNQMKHGGGIRLGGWATGSEIIGCRIYDNVASEKAGGIYSMLQSLATSGVTHTIKGNVIWGNRSLTNEGDSIYIGKSAGIGCGGGQCELEVILENNLIKSDRGSGWNTDDLLQLIVGNNNPIVRMRYNNVEGGSDSCEGVDEDIGTLNVYPGYDPIFNSWGGGVRGRGRIKPY